MNRWLVKSEPGTYAFTDLLKDGSTRWDGISAPAALLHLRGMRRGDEVLFYHSGAERAVVGLARAASDPYPDPALADPRRVVIDLKGVRALSRAIPLAEIKADRRFKNFGLVRISRLSVMPVSPDEWRALLALAS